MWCEEFVGDKEEGGWRGRFLVCISVLFVCVLVSVLCRWSKVVCGVLR